MSDPDDWPSYAPGTKDYFHAIGVQVAAWNSVEMAYSALMQFLIPNTHQAIHLFELLGNESRWQFINDEAKRSLPADASAEVAYFLKCAAICKENRNGIAHAKVTVQNDTDVIMLTKGRDKSAQRLKQYWFNVESLRQMADDTEAVADHGMQLWAALTIKQRWDNFPDSIKVHFPDGPEGWPYRPPLPRKWFLHSQPNPQGVAPPTESSPGSD